MITSHCEGSFLNAIECSYSSDCLWRQSNCMIFWRRILELFGNQSSQLSHHPIQLQCSLQNPRIIYRSSLKHSNHTTRLILSSHQYISIIPQLPIPSCPPLPIPKPNLQRKTYIDDISTSTPRSRSRQLSYHNLQWQEHDSGDVVGSNAVDEFEWVSKDDSAEDETFVNAE